MAVRRTGRQTGGWGAKKKPGKAPVKVIFWLGFIILLLILFLSNWESIQDSLRVTGLLDLLVKHRAETTATSTPADMPLQIEIKPAEPAPLESAVISGGAPVAVAPPAVLPETPPVITQTPPMISQPPQKSNETYRDRPIYMIQVDRDGFILRIRVTRNLPASDAPLRDVLQALLNGPSMEEQGRGLISLIPPGTSLLGATIQGSTARINFSEEFLFNTFGIEGYANSLQQVVWTATEFPNVKDVQFLIEGHVVNYLGESIQIGRPIGRNSL